MFINKKIYIFRFFEIFKKKSNSRNYNLLTINIKPMLRRTYVLYTLIALLLLALA